MKLYMFTKVWLNDNFALTTSPSLLQVNDVGYINADSIVITARERLGKGDGGMAVFSAATGELRHRFRVEHGQQQKSFTAGALSLAGLDDPRIFSSCKGRLNEYGIGLWDHNTGQQVDFFYEHPGCSLGMCRQLFSFSNIKFCIFLYIGSVWLYYIPLACFHSN
jgi:hypothetical protein